MAASRGHFLLAAWLLEQGASACATDALLRTPENVAATPALQITLELASRAELDTGRAGSPRGDSLHADGIRYERYCIDLRRAFTLDARLIAAGAEREAAVMAEVAARNEAAAEFTSEMFSAKAERFKRELTQAYEHPQNETEMIRTVIAEQDALREISEQDCYPIIASSDIAAMGSESHATPAEERSPSSPSARLEARRLARFERRQARAHELWLSSRLSSADKSCAVCYEGWSKHTVPVQAPKCGHVFCDRCLDRWLQKSRTCPLCRAHLCREDLRRLVIQ